MDCSEVAEVDGFIQECLPAVGETAIGISACVVSDQDTLMVDESGLRPDVLTDCEYIDDDYYDGEELMCCYNLEANDYVDDFYAYEDDQVDDWG